MERWRFGYDSSGLEGDIEFEGKLEIFVHHARNIHNICIYDNQDVYAKFSLTYNPDEMVSTQVIIGGGKNPEFNQKLELKVNQIDAVLKCEIWMLSRAKNLMEDQLIGFTLVSISEIVSKGGKISCEDYSLSSTDLFDSPAGIVQLSIVLTSLNSSVFSYPCRGVVARESGLDSDLVLLDAIDYSRIEFPDVNAAREDQMIISEYFGSNSDHSLGSFLHLGSLSRVEDICNLRVQDEDGDKDEEMKCHSPLENENGNENENEIENDISPSNRNSGVFSSTTTSQSDERNSVESNSVEKRSVGVKQSNADELQKVGVQNNNLDQIECGEHKGPGYTDVGRVFSSRVGNMEHEAEQIAMQQQIVDMYMKSMQQFTESLAKMTLPMDLKPIPDRDDNNRNTIRVSERSGGEVEAENKKEQRVFYGSRAFF